MKNVIVKCIPVHITTIIQNRLQTLSNKHHHGNSLSRIFLTFETALSTLSLPPFLTFAEFWIIPKKNCALKIPSSNFNVEHLQPKLLNCCRSKLNYGAFFGRKTASSVHPVWEREEDRESLQNHLFRVVLNVRFRSFDSINIHGEAQNVEIDVRLPTNDSANVVDATPTGGTVPMPTKTHDEFQ